MSSFSSLSPIQNNSIFMSCILFVFCGCWNSFFYVWVHVRKWFAPEKRGASFYFDLNFGHWFNFFKKSLKFYIQYSWCALVVVVWSWWIDPCRLTTPKKKNTKFKKFKSFYFLFIWFFWFSFQYCVCGWIIRTTCSIIGHSKRETNETRRYPRQVICIYPWRHNSFVQHFPFKFF